MTACLIEKVDGGGFSSPAEPTGTWSYYDDLSELVAASDEWADLAAAASSAAQADLGFASLSEATQMIYSMRRETVDYRRSNLDPPGWAYDGTYNRWLAVWRSECRGLSARLNGQ